MNFGGRTDTQQPSPSARLVSSSVLAPLSCLWPTMVACHCSSPESLLCSDREDRKLCYWLLGSIPWFPRKKKTKTYPTLDWNIFFVLLELEEDAPLGRSNSAATCYSRPLISSWEKTTYQGNGWLDIFWGSQVAGSKTSALSVTSSRILDIWSLRVTSYRCLRGVKYQCKQNIQKTEQHLSKNLESSDLVVSTLLFRSLTTGMSQLMKFPGTNHAEVQKFIWCVFLDPKTWDLAEDPTKSPTCHVIKMHETGKIEKYPAREEWQTTKLDKEKHLSAKRGRIRDDSR